MKRKTYLPKKIVLTAIIGCAVVLTSGYLVLTKQKTGISVCKGEPHAIQVKRNADEKTYPFLRFGKPLSAQIALQPAELAAYRNAVTEFPDIRSCLIDSRNRTREVNISTFNWQAMKSTIIAEVCLFRVFSSIGNAEDAEQWLWSQGFEASTSEVSPSVMRFSGHRKPGTQVYGHWSTKNCGSRLHGGWIGLISGFPISPHSLYVAGVYTIDGDVTGTSVGYSWK